MSEKKYKVFTCYTCYSSKYYNEKEVFNKPSLVDRNEKIPTLKEFIERYLITGEPLKEDYPNGELEEATDGMFTPMDLRDVDIEEKIQYQASLKKNKNYQAETGEENNKEAPVSASSKEEKKIEEENKEEEEKKK